MGSPRAVRRTSERQLSYERVQGVMYKSKLEVTEQRGDKLSADNHWLTYTPRCRHLFGPFQTPAPPHQTLYASNPDDILMATKAAHKRVCIVLLVLDDNTANPYFSLRKNMSPCKKNRHHSCGLCQTRRTS